MAFAPGQSPPIRVLATNGVRPLTSTAFGVLATNGVRPSTEFAKPDDVKARCDRLAPVRTPFGRLGGRQSLTTHHLSLRFNPHNRDNKHRQSAVLDASPFLRKSVRFLDGLSV
jgi:hypothetical protein